MAGKFTCNACGKSYSWKPELAGKRVKCKCGQPLSIPATDPAAANDDFGDLGALAALSEGDPTTPGAVPGGPTCPACGSGVDPAAVICVNCGQNLKTGKKLKTSKASAAAAAGGGGAGNQYGYRSYGAVSNDEGMSDKQKKLVMFSSLGGIAAVIAVIIAVVLPARQRAKAREREIDRRPAKLERIMTAAENAGGIGEAMKDGSAAAAIAADQADEDEAKAKAAAVPPGYEFNERHQRMLAEMDTKVGKKFLLDAKAKFQGKTREETERIIKEMYAMGCPSVSVITAPPDVYTNDPLASGLIAALPAEKEARTKVFAFYGTLENTIEPIDMDRQTDKGQKWISIEFKDPRGKR